MKSLVSFFMSLRDRARSLPATKKIFFGIFFLIFIFGLLGVINYYSNHFSIQQPARGGSIREGILGTPRFINPVLATSDVDRDLTQLIYSGLIRTVSNDFKPDSAESYTVSPDGKTYTFIIRKNATFHDHKKVTAADVAFTVTTVQDSRFQSPLASQWSGITVTTPDDHTVIFNLPRPYSGFLQTVASLGILPKHIWGTVTSDEFIASKYNVSPIGSGPYRITDINRDNTGTATEYILKSFKKFVLGNPYIKKFTVKFYPNEQDLFQAYESKDFDILANIHPYELTQHNTRGVVAAPLPRMFGLFINTNGSELLKDKKLQSVVNNVINRNEIIQNVFQGYAKPISHLFETNNEPTTIDSIEANKQLNALGWVMDSETGIRTKSGKQLRFSISTADTPELKYTAQIIQKQMKTIGIDIEIKVFQLNDLESNIIKKRSFETLLFGQLIKNDGDLYAFWHSSQQTNTGLNITGYTNTKLDTLLETLIATADPVVRTKTIESLQQELNQVPVIWLYQPDLIYASHINFFGITLQSILSKSDRFLTIYQWYTTTDHVWKFLAHEKI